MVRTLNPLDHGFLAHVPVAAHRVPVDPKHQGYLPGLETSRTQFFNLVPHLDDFAFVGFRHVQTYSGYDQMYVFYMKNRRLIFTDFAEFLFTEIADAKLPIT
ncbi:MAG: hypothetical protein LIO91_11810, partial [Bacteroidales bacterium]|nr:hypothetical protein [Bacteroidales bacterium]